MISYLFPSQPEKLISTSVVETYKRVGRIYFAGLYQCRLPYRITLCWSWLCTQKGRQ